MKRREKALKTYKPKQKTDLVTAADLEAAKAAPKLPSEIGIPEGTPEYSLAKKDTTGQEIEKPKHLRFEGMSATRCPLCHRHFERMWSNQRKKVVLICQRDQIGIAEDDRLVGHWEEVTEKMEKGMLDCPVCGTKMRFFCTSLKFMKAKCPRPHGVAMTLSEPDAKKEPNSVSPVIPLETPGSKLVQ
ncbi:MAG: hypothetical protein KGJ13_02310 [Patescibacteria group bacterium]|nr:hypothetical protein [Patescibacteria group bacterium]